MSSALSTSLSTVEELRITLNEADAGDWDDVIIWRRFFQRFQSVKALRTDVV
jgi:hypothetical protein